MLRISGPLHHESRNTMLPAMVAEGFLELRDGGRWSSSWLCGVMWLPQIHLESRVGLRSSALRKLSGSTCIHCRRAKIGYPDVCGECLLFQLSGRLAQKRNERLVNPLAYQSSNFYHQQANPHFSMKVVIVGAGPSGLVACKSLLEAASEQFPFDPLILEQEDDIGGTFRYRSYEVQNTKIKC